MFTVLQPNTDYRAGVVLFLTIYTLYIIYLQYFYTFFSQIPYLTHHFLFVFFYASCCEILNTHYFSYTISREMSQYRYLNIIILSYISNNTIYFMFCKNVYRYTAVLCLILVFWF